MDIGTILSTVLFLGPGFLLRLISTWIEEPACDEESTEVIFTKSFIFSFIILIANMMILKLVFHREINTFTDLINNIYNIIFFVKYCILTVFICIFVAILKPIAVKLLVEFYNNIFNKKKDRKYTTFNDLWNIIFYNPDFDVSKHVFTIQKNETIITHGFIKNVTPKGRGKKKIILTLTDIVSDYFNDKEFAEKNLSEIVVEYYDFDSDILIKAYHAEAIIEDIDNRIASAKSM
ncbi:hypothetical protein [Clostridium sp.]|jgi:hypothetical protein|uniref:hypothetical protein n=1 Tax=Clostridium sp. TaxID=1506 RepID=UPI00258D023D|nr:hypothetical protein [Clostridium sp.]MDF2505606.1 hypothetical protein [Clostridium sp.]